MIAAVSPSPAEVAAVMYANDAATQALGIAIKTIGSGCATLTMPVRADMVNGHNIAHGGMMFTLCDTAFAYACNSYNQNTVAAGCSIEYLNPAFVGDMLTAIATEVTLQGRHGVYDVALTRSDASGASQTVALFRGKSAQIKGNIIAISS